MLSDNITKLKETIEFVTKLFVKEKNSWYKREAIKKLLLHKGKQSQKKAEMEWS